MSVTLLHFEETAYTLELSILAEGKKEALAVLKEEAGELALPSPPACLSEEEYQNLKALDLRQKAVKKALSYLKVRPYSKRGLYGKLMEKGFSSFDSRFAVLTVAKYGYFHEKEDIRQVVMQMAEGGHGPRKAKEYLARHGYSEKDVAHVLEALAEEGLPNWAQAKEKALARIRASGKAKTKEKERAMLFYLGFGDDEW